MAKPIGIWTAAELLADTVQPASSESRGIKSQSAPMLAAFELLPLAAAERRCLVKGRRGQNGMWEPIPADLWFSLTIDPIAAKSDDDAEYSEAQAHPTRLGPDYYENIWNDLRWNRAEIEALRPCFKAWYEAGRPRALPNAQTVPGEPTSRKVAPREQATRGGTPASLPLQEASEEARAAEERSREMKREAAARLFAEPFWPASRVIAWIAFRDPTQIQADWRAAKMYTKMDPAHAPAPLKDNHPRMTLLRALQYDNLRAIKEGNELPREAWVGATGRDWPAVHFRREDVLALWPDPHSEDAGHLTWKEIAHRWSKLAGEPEDKMMRALTGAFWRGEFEPNQASEVFILQPPNGPASPPDKPLEELPGQYAYSSGFPGEVTKVGGDGEHYPTAERRAGRLRRREVAAIVGGMPNFVPWQWDGTDHGLRAYADVPYANWPATMREYHFEEWRLCRDDFARWYAGAAAIWPKPPLESMWPNATVGIAAMSPVHPEMQDFESRLGWMPLTKALEIVKLVAGGSAWGEIKTAIRHNRLRARGLADGVTLDFEPHWFDFPAWDSPDNRDNLWFDSEKARRKGVRVPGRVENIVVEFDRIAELWPGSVPLPLPRASGVNQSAPPQSAPEAEKSGAMEIPSSSASSSLRRVRGRRPEKLEAVKQAMRDDIKERRVTVADLQGMLEKSLAATYNASRDTTRKARNAVLSEFVGNSTLDK